MHVYIRMLQGKLYNIIISIGFKGSGANGKGR